MSVRFLWVSLVFGFLPVTGVQAGEGHDSHQHEPHSHHDRSEHQSAHADETVTEAHVHGEVMLQLALQGSDLVMKLESPAMNIVGFEYRASTPEQIKRVEAAEAKLRLVTDWLTLDGGECRATDVTTDVSGVLPEAKATEDNHGHADIDLDVQFTCARPDKLRGLQVTLFRDFPGVEKMTVQWVLETAAGEGGLTRNKPGLTFNQ